MATKQILGIVDVDVDGTTLLQDNATLDPGGYNRTVVKGSKVYGFRQEVQEATLECEVAIDGSFSVDFFRNITNSTITMRADTGQTWVMNNAWIASPPPVGQKDGKAKVKFMGPSAQEII